MSSEHSVPINEEVFRMNRTKKGFTDADLAGASGVGVRTIARIKDEWRARPDTARRIAAAFGIRLEELINGIDPPVVESQSPEKRCFDVILDVAVPLDEMDKAAQDQLMAILKKVIGGTSPIEILQVREGSTKLRLSMIESDILRLLAAMLDNDLDLLRITRVAIPDHSWLIIILALLNYDNGRLRPQSVGEEQISSLLQDRTLERALNMKTRACLICKKID